MQSERVAAIVANLGCIIAFVKAGVVKDLARALWICCGKLKHNGDGGFEGLCSSNQRPAIADNALGMLYLTSAHISVRPWKLPLRKLWDLTDTLPDQARQVIRELLQQSLVCTWRICLESSLHSSASIQIKTYSHEATFILLQTLRLLHVLLEAEDISVGIGEARIRYISRHLKSSSKLIKARERYDGNWYDRSCFERYTKICKQVSILRSLKSALPCFQGAVLQNKLNRLPDAY